MNDTKPAVDVMGEPRHLGALGGRLVRMGALVGVAGMALSVAIAVATGETARFFFAYLTNYMFFLSLALGALFLVILHHLTRSGWSVVVRRLAEGVAATLPVLAILFVPILVGMRWLYAWTVPSVAAADPLIQAKAAYLNVPFFLVRCAVYFGLWVLLSRYFVGRSLAQDESGDVGLTTTMQKASALSMVGFALTLTFAAFDLIMSLDAHWYSTMFGVYYFAGAVVGIFALVTMLAYGAQRAGLLRNTITVEHYHDLGKLLFAFVVFWGYIAFSQYMLIWYANLPEETGWLLRRQTHGWGWVGLALLFGQFGVPFLALISRSPKRRPRILVTVAVWAIAMHWVDVYWLVMPEGSPLEVLPRLVDLTLFVGEGGILLAAGAWALRERSLVPERDPRLEESLRFENA